ncbi:MAG: system Galactitol-specific component [Proteobacteria bacterium]|nr:system Galactitol-specific component [Pseudomonadota bacterium]
MEALQSALTWFFSFKAYVMLPVVIGAIALLARVKPGPALMLALKLGVGFAGIFLVYDAFLSMLKPAVEAIVATRGLNYPVIDAGWPPLAAITWASWIAPVSIALVIGLNLVMVFARLTDTLYIDIWNYWHFAFLGALVLSLTANPALAFAAVALIAVYSFKATEWSAPYVQRATGMEGIGVSPFSVTAFLPWAVALDRVFDAIPGVRRIVWDPSRSGGKLAVLGQPIVIGALLGVFLGVLGHYDIRKLAELAIQIATVMYLLPKCGALIGEAMNQVSDALRLRLDAKLAGRSLVIAMDSPFLFAHPSVMTTGLVLMPLSLILAFLIPGNRMIPAGDLPNLISIMSLSVLVFRGNVFRAVLSALPIVIAFMLVASDLAPLLTRLGAQSGVAALAQGGSEVTAFTDGGNPVRYWMFKLFLGEAWAWLLLPVGLGFVWFAWRRNRVGIA